MMTSAQNDRFQTPGPLRLRIRNTAGEVRVETVDGDETTVELEALGDDGVSHAAVEDARVELRERSGGLELRVEIPERSSRRNVGLRSPEVAVRVTCPAGADVIANTVSADVDASGRYGNAEFHTVSGDVRIGSSAGATTLRSVSGDLHAAYVGAGPVIAHSVSGDIHIGVRPGVRVWIDAHSLSGDVAIVDSAGMPVQSG